MSDRKDCGPAVLLDRQLSPNSVVCLLSAISSKSLDNPVPKDEEVFGASFILTCAYAHKATFACPEHPGNLERTSKTFAAVISDAEAHCSENTA